MTKKTTKKSQQAKVALCYVRQSFTRDDDDKNSPERQRANITAVIERKGWTPEWYEDVGGHKSGRQEKNRPAWLKLKARLGDPDVVALVANDLSRLHRKGWRVGDLIDHLERNGVALVLAAPNREVDTSTPLGRMFIQFGAIVDEYYVHDIAERAKDSTRYRKKRGITIGRPPFGTVRNEQGFLVPSPDGAWLLAEGRFVSGSPDDPPEAGAIWRSYYETARLILKLYVKENIGYEKIAYRLNEEGWPFRDRRNRPRPVDREDVRRVVGAWPEYGGVVLDMRAKDRKAYEDTLDLDTFPFRKDRAVFDIELLRRVAKTRRARSRKPVDHGVNRKTYPYALSNITYCAHCLRLAEEQDDPRLRSTLGGINMNGIRRYRHKAGVSCGVTNRSVPCAEFEADVGRLLKLLEVTPEALKSMTELAIQADLGHRPDLGDRDPEQEKREAIALCNRRIEAAVTLYKEGRIDYDEYRETVDKNEREIAHWEARTTEVERIAMELAMCMDVVNNMAAMWDSASPEDKQGMARNLFEYLVFDLDTRRIVDFRLKPWADRFLILRASLYDRESGGVPGEEMEREGVQKEKPHTPEGVHTEMPHRGLEPLFPP